MIGMARAGRVLGCLAILLVLVGAGAAGYGLRRWWLPLLGYALDVSPRIRSADVIIILGGGDGDREEYGSRLYHLGLAPHVIATGAPPGSRATALDLERRGVPRSVILLANGTRNTHEDALAARTLVLAHGWRSALLVTDPYHMRRSLWTFETAFAGTGVQIWPAPVVGGWFDASRWWQDEDGFVAVNGEYLKLVYYLARGYIAPSVIMER
jgi:uncharacterized SAM-binding protein YcdF (DUF218 family)